jgi:hypothetical protein
LPVRGDNDIRALPDVIVGCAQPRIIRISINSRTMPPPVVLMIAKSYFLM